VVKIIRKPVLKTYDAN
jgi:hypothetical protein